MLLAPRKARNEICLNDDKGHLKQSIFFEKFSDRPLQTQVIDLNRDGLLEIIESNSRAWNLYDRAKRE